MAKTKRSAARRQSESSAEAESARASASSEAASTEDAGEKELAEDGLSFEGALERLEETVARLETGEMPLEEALTLFEQGVKLSRQCATTLEAAEKRVEILVAGRGDDWHVAPFEPHGDADAEADPEPDEDDEDFD